jgi:parvulin-like peptidyl-prolyl isomerase
MLYWPRATQREETAAKGAFSMRRLVLFGFASLALVLAACGGTSTASLGSDDVAVVGDQQITKEQFQQLMARAQKSYDAQKRAFPKAGSAEYEQLKGQAITFLVQQAEVDEQAHKLGADVSDSDVDKEIARYKKQFYGGSDARWEKAVKQQGLTDEQARDAIKQQLVSKKVQDKVTSDVKVSDADIKQYYDTHKTQYVQPESREVRHILVTKKALADSLYQQLKSGGNFAKLAKQYSKDPGSAANGGKLTVSKGQTVPQFDKTAFSLKTNAISQPVHTQYGYHIIQALSAIKPATTTTLSQVRASIRQQLEQQKKNDEITKWLEDTKKGYCSGKIKYQVGYQPNPDPCATLTSATSTASQ